MNDEMASTAICQLLTIDNLAMSLVPKPQKTVGLALIWGTGFIQIPCGRDSHGREFPEKRNAERVYRIFCSPTGDASGGNLWGEDWIFQLTLVDRGGNETKTLSFPLKFDGGGQVKPLPADLEKALKQRLGRIKGSKSPRPSFQGGWGDQ